jgi:hypothetical protein
MSSGLMDTEKGGEQTQYEAEHTDVYPHKQEAGQLGGTAPILTLTPGPTLREDAMNLNTH